MRRRDKDLERLFLVGLSLAAASCAGAAGDASEVPLGSASVGASSATSPPNEKPPASVTPIDIGPPPDPSTPEGYARGYRSAGPFTAALSGLELQGFVDYDGKLVCEDEKPCPAAWDALATGDFSRAAIVKKRYSLAAITTTNFFEWVGPVQDPERAALRARLEEGRTTSTCGKLAELGYPCATGSDPAGIPVRAVDNGFEVVMFDSRNVCDGGRWGNAVSIGALVIDREGEARDTDNVLIDATDAKARETTTCHYAVKGRRPRGWVDATPSAEDSLLAYLLRSAREEAAAAVAFEELASELGRHGAPEELVRDARAAASDERRHAAIFRREAARRAPGIAVEAAAPGSSPRRTRRRSLISMLVENAREGCANETYAAVVATYQAAHAPTRRERALFRGIARDEQRHAALAHRIHAWGREVVGGAARRSLDAALDAAIEGFAVSGATTPAGLALGEPEPVIARSAFAEVVRALRVREERPAAS